MKKSVSKVDERLGKLFTPHPLTVEVHVMTRDGNAIIITYTYLINLNVVTAKVKLSLNKESKSITGEVIMLQFTTTCC